MNCIESIKKAFVDHIKSHYPLDSEILRQIELTINTDERKQAFGDITTNSALILAPIINQQPRVIASQLAQGFTHLLVERTEVAGPGFINIVLKSAAWATLAKELFETDTLFFKPEDKQLPMVNIEFVSANPTGPLHFGHGRGGILGDVLAKVLRFVGYVVNTEFYINDAGAQIEKLGNSFKIRCQQAAGMDIQMPEDAYHGSYLIDLAQGYIHTHGIEGLNKDHMFFAAYAQDHMLLNIKKTLADYGIAFDTWFSEKSLHSSNSIVHALDILEKNGYLYRHEDAVWFRSTVFGDDKDRVVRKSDGTLTYIAADIAYLQNKVDRGAQKLIMVLGHDHHSYATRLETVRQALGLTQIPLDVILYQLVKIKQGDQQVRMSKRKGAIVTLQDVIDTVGSDVARFFYLHRKADAQLEFDLDLALTKTEDNPVYYVQYAYVRTNSILDKAQEVKELQLITPDDMSHIGQEEAFILKKIASLKVLLTDIARHYQTHLLTHYSIELAHAFHAYYRHNRIIDMSNIAKSRARLGLIHGINSTFKTVLSLMGLSTPERM
ncbi:MAG TPA: arginine--tRNA ligase [Candidatus Babeliales bacterium]|jgi:arginyl-tRNA synthetase|nr:arginine--tRNA ligase [Candidatus Babeliales bacterium]